LRIKTLVSHFHLLFTKCL